jgi:hypothetical protein
LEGKGKPYGGKLQFLRVFHAGAKGAGFFLCNMRVYKGISLEVAFFALFSFFCIAFLKGQVAFSPTLLTTPTVDCVCVCVFFFSKFWIELQKQEKFTYLHIIIFAA